MTEIRNEDIHATGSFIKWNLLQYYSSTLVKTCDISQGNFHFFSLTFLFSSIGYLSFRSFLQLSEILGKSVDPRWPPFPNYNVITTV